MKQELMRIISDTLCDYETEVYTSSFQERVGDYDKTEGVTFESYNDFVPALADEIIELLTEKVLSALKDETGQAKTEEVS